MSDGEGKNALIEILSALDEVPPILSEHEAAWASIEDSPRLGNRMKASLRLVAAGLTYREAARAVMYADHRHVFRAAKRLGLASVRSEQLVQAGKRIAALCAHEIEDRLVESPEDVSMRDLAVTRGIEMDKVAKRENWGKESDEGSSFASAMERVAQAASRGEIEVELKVSPRPERPREIDVTPPEVAPDNGSAST